MVMSVSLFLLISLFVFVADHARARVCVRACVIVSVCVRAPMYVTVCAYVLSVCLYLCLCLVGGGGGGTA